MNLVFFEEFADPYLKGDFGKGVFLAGVALGMMAKEQAGRGGDWNNSPLFKQISFGRLQLRDLKRHLSRAPELIKAYDMNYTKIIEALVAKAGMLILSGGSKELEADGNFVFAIAFMNAPTICFEKIFKKQEAEQN
ncbi:TM1802 family CRISPR-associated protein [Thermovirga lienii]|jgi:hypothetical protein|uniref:TM1802 family CRISPR-associated protein n=1 Tax=Thermovirga lienii TaxID=336261 RepID=UPI002FE16070